MDQLTGRVARTRSDLERLIDHEVAALARMRARRPEAAPGTPEAKALRSQEEYLEGLRTALQDLLAIETDMGR